MKKNKMLWNQEATKSTVILVDQNDPISSIKTISSEKTLTKTIFFLLQS